jgi:hypothetical protein
MCLIRTLFLLLALDLCLGNACLVAPALAAPKKRAVLAPEPLVPPLLRVEQISIVPSAASPKNVSSAISVRVVNRSLGSAREVSAYVSFRSGYAIPLRGPRRVPASGRVVYVAASRIPPRLLVDPRITLSCAGCGR